MRLLSICGGGVRGLVAATMLAEFEKAIAPTPLHQYFDLFCGTSSGAIIASALAYGYTASQVAAFFRTYAQTIFPYQSIFSCHRFPLLFRHGLDAPKFDSSGLEALLFRLFNQKLFHDLRSPRLMVLSFDSQRREPLVFKSWRSDKFRGLKLREILLASAAAPTYFPAYKLEVDGKTISAIDGGVAANDASLCCLAEAIRLGADLSNIHLLCIGTGNPTREIVLEQAQNWGIIGWASRIVDLLLESPASSTCYVAEQLLGDHYLQLQFKLSRQITGERLNDDIDDSTDTNLKNLANAATAYAQTPEIQQKIHSFTSKISFQY